MSPASDSIAPVCSYLPHRFPFLLIDSIEQVDIPRITCKKLVSYSEPVFQGHFPGYPVFPGVMTVEASAQASGILLHFIEDQEVMKNRLGLFAGIEQVRFRKMVLPGEVLTIHSEWITKKMGVYFFNVSVEVETQTVMKGKIQVMLAPAPTGWTTP
jgi:3-hydroxyacyl-[acyl-carrier-protein] dehydratase